MGTSNLFADFENKWMAEKDVVRLLINSKNKGGKFDVGIFSNLIYSPIKANDNIGRYKGFYVADHIERRDINLPREGKPGDLDILLIPYTAEKIYFEHTAVFEVKIARPTLSRINKDANSRGSTQINGLIEDGFPLIGLIHICMSEPLPKNHLREIKVLNNPVYTDTLPPGVKRNQKKDYAPLDSYTIQKYDPLPLFTCDNQWKRLILLGLPKFIGLNCIAINSSINDHYWFASTFLYDDFKAGYFNPNVKLETIKSIENHFIANREKYLHIENL